MKVMAVDFGAARTGVAVSDPTGVIARPLCVVQRAATWWRNRLLRWTVAGSRWPDGSRAEYLLECDVNGRVAVGSVPPS